MFNNFTAGTSYYVVVNGCEPLEFSIAGNQAKDVSYIVIDTATLVKDTDTDVKVLLYNKDNVDITPNVGTADIVLTSSDSLKLWPQGGLKATMYNVGDTADLTATFTYYDPNNNYEATVIKATKTITCVAAAVAQKTGLIYTVGGSKSSPKSYLAIGDTPKFNAWLKETLNGTTNERQVGKDNFGNIGATYARVADTSIAMITADDGAGNYTIKGNQVGTTYVFICYTNSSGKEVIFDSCPIEVRAARFAQNVALSVDKSNLNINANLAKADTVTITAKVTDNYGDAINTAPSYTQLEASKQKGVVTTGLTWANPETGKYTLTLDKSQIAYKADGAIVLTVNAGDKSNKPNVNFSIADKGDVATGYTFTADKTTLDTSINKIKTPIASAKVSLVGVKDGYFVAGQNYTYILSGSEATPVNSTAVNFANASGAAFVLDIKKDSKRLDLTATVAGNIAYGDLVVNNNDGTFTLSTYISDSGNIVKLPKGNYTFELYIIKDNKIDGSVRRVNITVSDNQVAPTFTKKEQSITKAGSAIACFEFKFDGNVQATTAVTDSTNDPKNKTTFVKKCSVTVAITDNNGNATGNLVLSVDVNTLLND